MQFLSEFQWHFIQNSHERDGLTKAGELDSDSVSDKTNGPAGVISSISSCSPRPSNPVQSPHPHFAHLSRTTSGTGNSPRGNYQPFCQHTSKIISEWVISNFNWLIPKTVKGKKILNL